MGAQLAPASRARRPSWRRASGCPALSPGRGRARGRQEAAHSRAGSNWLINPFGSAPIEAHL